MFLGIYEWFDIWHVDTHVGKPILLVQKRFLERGEREREMTVGLKLHCTVAAAQARLSEAAICAARTTHDLKEPSMAKKQPAARRPVAVVDYEAAWNIKSNHGAITIRLQSGRPVSISPIDTHSEFIAILTLLQGEKTVFAMSSGVLTTAP